jgi:hypothetical protein
MVLTCFRGALPPVLLRAVCLVRAMASILFVDDHDDCEPNDTVTLFVLKYSQAKVYVRSSRGFASTLFVPDVCKINAFAFESHQKT